MRLSIAARAACAVLLASAVMGACDTDAQGIEDCREIERARCRGARYCDVGIDTTEDVEACERFMRDDCLHGFEVDDDNSSTELRACVEAIQAAGECARDGDGEGTGVDANARSCGGLLNVVGPTRSACEVVDRPELHPACQFLVAVPPPEPDAAADPPPPTPTPDAGDAG